MQIGPRRPAVDGIVQRDVPRLDDLAEIGAFAPLGAKLIRLDDLARCEAHDDAAARPEASAANDWIVLEVDDPRFRSYENLVAGRAAPAHRPQAGTVERGADRVAVGEDDRSRSVPRLDGRHVRVVVGAQALVVAFDRRREQQIDGLVDAIPGTDHRVDGIIEIIRVRDACERLDPARFEPGAISGDRVDLAVVRDVPEGLNQAPRRRRVRREALVEERETRSERFVAQVFEVRAELVGRKQPFVDDRSRRTRRARSSTNRTRAVSSRSNARRRAFVRGRSRGPCLR